MYLFLIIQYLFWPIIIGLIIFFTTRHFRKKRKGAITEEHEWYLQLFYSRSDGVSQMFFLLAVLSLGVSIFALNRDLGEIITIKTIILFISAIALFSAYYFRVLLLLPVGMFGLVGWWAAMAADWTEKTDIKAIIIISCLMLVAAIFYLLGRAHEKKIEFKRFSLVYTILGTISITGGIFYFSVRNGLRSLVYLTKGEFFFGSWQLVLSLFFLLTFFIYLLWRTNREKIIYNSELTVLFLVTLFFIGISFLPEQAIFISGSSYYLNQGFTASGIVWALFFNVLIFLNVLGIIMLGYLKKEKQFINIGAFFLFVLIVVKYFDWFFTFFDKSIFFISAGILMFVVGWFMEKGRKYMLKTVATSQALNQNHGNE